MATLTDHEVAPLAANAAEPGLSAARAALLADVSVEVLPRDADRLAAAADPVPPGTTVYVPFLPTGTLAGSLAAARRLRAAGFDPVVHLPARRLRTRGELAEFLGAAREGGIDAILLLAGDVETPVGPFADTLDVLSTGLVEAAGLSRVGFAGHPEGHPKADVATLDRAIAEKVAWAAATDTRIWLVTQFVFDAGPLAAWEARLRLSGFRLPVRAGVPGPAGMRTVLSFALQCGVATSARALARRPEAARMLGRWTPDAVVEGIAAHRAHAPESLLAGLHLYPFGGLDKTLAWLAEARRRAPAPAG